MCEGYSQRKDWVLHETISRLMLGFGLASGLRFRDHLSLSTIIMSSGIIIEQVVLLMKQIELSCFILLIEALCQ